MDQAHCECNAWSVPRSHLASRDRKTDPGQQTPILLPLISYPSHMHSRTRAYEETGPGNCSLSLQVPSLGSTLSVALELGPASHWNSAGFRTSREKDLETTGRAVWDSGPSSGLRIRLTWAQLSSITSMPHVTPAVSPSLSQSNKYKVLNSSWHLRRASYITILIIKSCLTVQSLKSTCYVTLCKSLHFSKVGVQKI